MKKEKRKEIHEGMKTNKKKDAGTSLLHVGTAVRETTVAFSQRGTCNIEYTGGTSGRNRHSNRPPGSCDSCSTCLIQASTASIFPEDRNSWALGTLTNK